MSERYAVLDDEGRVVNIILADPKDAETLGLRLREARDDDVIEVPVLAEPAMEEPTPDTGSISDSLARLSDLLDRLEALLDRLAWKRNG